MRARVWLAGLLLACALLAVTAGRAAAFDDYPCGPETTASWSSAPENPFGDAVQQCPLTAPLPPNDWVPVYDAPVESPPGGPAPDPAGWLHDTSGQYFVCQTQTDVEYHHPSGDWTNDWWAWTLSDDGNWGWVPEAFFQGGNDDEPDGGLRICPDQGGPDNPPGPPPPPPITVPLPPVGPPPPTPCDRAPRVRAKGMRLTVGARHGHRSRRAAVTVRLGQTVVIRGTITRSGGTPRSHARVCVAVRQLGGAPGHAGPVVMTDARGRFSFVWHASASTQLSFVRGEGASGSVVVQVRPAVGLRATRTALRNGEVLTLVGSLRPKLRSAGVLIELQALVGRRWQTFGTTSTHRDGRFSYGYRFIRTTGVQVYALRARVPAQLGYPFAAGASFPVSVRVSG